MITDNLFINGPILCMRLEGVLNGVKKIIYLFGNYHLNMYKQLKCNMFDSIDFTQFFIKTMKKTNINKTFHLFFQTSNNNIYKITHDEPYTNTYMDEFFRFFNYKVNVNISKNYGPKNKINIIKNKYISNEKKNDNLILHFADNRNYFSEKINILLGDLYSIINSIKNDVIINNIKNTDIINDDVLNILSYKFKNITDELDLSLAFLLDTEHKNNKLFIENEYYIKLKNKSLKILNNYDDDDDDNDDTNNNLDIKDTLLNKTFIIENIKKFYLEIITLHTNILDCFNKLNILIKKYYNSLYTTKYNISYDIPYNVLTKKILIIVKLIYEYDDKFIYLFSLIMDLNNLRKILIKTNTTQITNSIFYTESFHSFNYMYVLVKYFNFKITHFTNDEITIDKLTEIIKTKKYSHKLAKYFFPKNLTQCINLKNFPDSFE
jgi:hypothetical protein